MKSLCFLAVLLLISVGPAVAADDYAPKQFVPGSVDEALRALPRTRSEGKDWDQFATMSSAKYRARRHTVHGDEEYQVTAIYFAADGGDPARLETIVEPGDGGPNRSDRTVIKTPTEPKPDAVRYLNTEEVTIGTKSYTAKVYEIDTTSDYDQGGALMTRNRLWLVPRIPNGLAKSEAFQIESTELEKPSGHFMFRLLDVSVPIEAAGKKFTCYCTEHEELWPDGQRVVTREWKTAAVPGGIVRSSQHTTRAGVEEVVDLDLIEFEAIRPLPPDEAVRERQLREAHALLQMGNAPASIAAFDAVLETGEAFPGRAAAFCDRGWAKWSNGDQAGAMADYDTAIRLDSHLADAYSNRAFAKLATADFKGALKDFNRAIDERPEFGRAIGGRAIVYMRLNKDKLALKDYETVITKWPNLKDSLDQQIEQARQARK